MKKILLLFLVCMFSAVRGYAQSEVTKFLGIPIDGTKSDMIKELKGKGFSYDLEYDLLEGEFNGTDVYVSVVTNNNKVYRICVADRNYISETDIRIRFNNLCYQFGNNKKYMGKFEDYIIPQDEDISYEMSVHNKRYQASFYQKKGSNGIFELDGCEDRNVWFMIDERYGKYRILMYYDNLKNQANGEDL